MRILVTSILLLGLGVLLFVSMGLNSLLAFPVMVLSAILITKQKEMAKRTEIIAVGLLEVTLVLFFLPGFYYPVQVLPLAAEVSVGSVTCDASTLVCTATLVNSGNADTSVIACSITYEGTTYNGSVRGSGSQNVPAGGQATTLCDLSGKLLLKPNVGSNYTGTFSMSNGANTFFSGVWS